jgi:hypothetical protein
MLRRSHDEDPVVKAWRRFCAKLARRGTERRLSEGPRAFAARAAAEQPQAAGDVAAIGELYVRLRYRPAPDPTLVAALQQRVRDFRP